MPKKQSAWSVGKIIAMAKALWDFYWYVVVCGSIWLDGKYQDWKRKRRKRKAEKKKDKRQS